MSSALWFMAWGLVLVAVWLNDNPLYGGQPEPVIPALLVGAIAALGAAGPPLKASAARR